MDLMKLLKYNDMKIDRTWWYGTTKPASFAHRRSIRPWTSEEQERGEEEGRREEEKKSRTGKRGKTAHVALLSSSRSCLILVRPTPLIVCCASASSLLHDAVMCSMERH